MGLFGESLAVIITVSGQLSSRGNHGQIQKPGGIPPRGGCQEELVDSCGDDGRCPMGLRVGAFRWKNGRERMLVLLPCLLIITGLSLEAKTGSLEKRSGNLKTSSPGLWSGKSQQDVAMAIKTMSRESTAIWTSFLRGMDGPWLESLSSADRIRSRACSIFHRLSSLFQWIDVVPNRDL
jgi:hypothetical protein